MGRVLTGLLGRFNVGAPTLAGLSTNFGLQVLIDKPLALISDARLSTKADAGIVVERLLSVSGEDSITVDRKYRDPWTGRLPSRFLILTNVV
jgi:putative DNA primase/helicase